MLLVALYEVEWPKLTALLYLNMWYPLPCYHVAKRPLMGAILLGFPVSITMNQRNSINYLVSFYCSNRKQTKMVSTSDIQFAGPKIKHPNLMHSLGKSKQDGEGWCFDVSSLIKLNLSLSFQHSLFSPFIYLFSQTLIRLLSGGQPEHYI